MNIKIPIYIVDYKSKKSEFFVRYAQRPTVEQAIAVRDRLLKKEWMQTVRIHELCTTIDKVYIKTIDISTS